MCRWERIASSTHGRAAAPACAAGKGMDNYCMAPRLYRTAASGGYADHLLVPHPRYLIDAGGIDPAWAATLSCSGLSTYAATCPS